MISNAWQEDGIEDDDVIISQQDKVAIHAKTHEVVIRQTCHHCRDDVLILVRPEYAERLAGAILELVDFLREDDGKPTAIPRHRPVTPAERKRRQREREKSRHEGHDANVTSRGTDGTVVELPFAPPLNGEDEEEEAHAS